MQIEKMILSLDYKSDTFSIGLHAIKVMFSVASLAAFWVYSTKLREHDRSHLGQVQKWLQFLLLQLIGFNDPFCFLTDELSGTPQMMYDMLQSFCESCFIAWVLFFWLVFIHSVASTDLAITVR